ncbi:universal stress protein [Streptomyces sp. B6B3]|uniref:universal stress protein n=1 Tax=Streptomyces sp. B6B3 TaxID=3153570 RepID=UPI00325D1521
MEDPVVVGVDGSRPSLAALDWAVDEAARHHRALRLVHGLEGEIDDALDPQGAERAAREVLAAAEERARARRPEVAVCSEALDEDPVHALVHESRVASVLVVGSRGKAALTGMSLGSVGLGVAARATCASVVVRGSESSRRGDHGVLLLGLAGTPRDLPAARFAFSEARARGSAVRAVHVGFRPEAKTRHATGGADETDTAGVREVVDETLDATADAYADVSLHREVIEGPPRGTLLAAAESVDLLVVGARQRGGVAGLQLGLLSHALLHLAPCPVAVVPEG